MLNKKTITLLILVSLFFLHFIPEDAFYVINKKDVELKIPKGFPKPIYNFKNNTISPETFVLGRKLFYDPILSKDSSISCGSCHQQFAAFAHIDHSLAHGIGGKIGNRNVSALQNLIWNKEFMWDGGINHIEVQALAPINNKLEMNESIDSIIYKLNLRQDYRIAFYNAYKDSAITTEKILKSITQFVGLMVSANSKYDKYMMGKANFSDEEKKGLQLFRKNCASCHQEPLFTDNSIRSNGLPINPKLNDKGRYIIIGNENNLYKFKVPSLRNVELTFPYMHDGRFKNIAEVMNYYRDTSKHTNYTDPSIHKLYFLSKDEAKLIETFLLTLTDKTFIYDRRFADPNFRRK